jgi:hypothetical protein
MNLHGIASGIISAINPPTEALLQASSGSTTLPSGKRQPTYEAIDFVTVQVQPMTTSDIMKVDGLNLQSKARKFWMTGSMEAIVRVNKLGGDIITVTDGVWKGVWLINVVIEQWPEWVSVIATLQNEDALSA